MMTWFLRKSFRLGPLRLNLSKRGVGASVGVTGARIGVDASGKPYAAGGRGGLYFRERLDRTQQRRSSAAASRRWWWSLALVVVLVVAAAFLLAGCQSVSAIAPTYTQDELKGLCERQHGCWHPDSLLGGYCEFKS
jgi:uncharacterized protein DUF4236